MEGEVRMVTPGYVKCGCTCEPFVQCSTRNGVLVGLYADEVCPHGACDRPLGHDGGCSQPDETPSPDAVPYHPQNRCQQEALYAAARRVMQAMTKPGYRFLDEPQREALRHLGELVGIPFDETSSTPVRTGTGE